MRDRFVLLGVARARAGWFNTVAQWSAGAMLSADFVRCVSLEEVRARLASGRAFSAVLVDGQLNGLDRDLIAAAAERGVAVLVVDGTGLRPWRELGAAAVLAEAFSLDELVEVLGATARPIRSGAAEPVVEPTGLEGERGELVAVCGPGGTGASTVAIALAQGLSDLPVAEAGRAVVDRADGRQPRILLADLCRVADQAMLHDSRVLVPGIEEVVEAHRTALPARHELLRQTFDVPERGYRLLLGLRRPRHWVGLRPRALERAMDSLQVLADVVVADVEADVEGQVDTGSIDVEERNLLARETMTRADLVLVVAEPSMKGVYAAVRTIGELATFGVPAARVLPVVNRSPRSPRRRAELTATIAELVTTGIPTGESGVQNPLHLPERAVDEALRDGAELPDALARPLAGAVSGLRLRLGRRNVPLAHGDPEPVVPGTLEGFTLQSGQDPS